jgi:hypothetical protein
MLFKLAQSVPRQVAVADSVRGPRNRHECRGCVGFRHKNKSLYPMANRSVFLVSAQKK